MIYMAKKLTYWFTAFQKLPNWKIQSIKRNWKLWIYAINFLHYLSFCVNMLLWKSVNSYFGLTHRQILLFRSNGTTIYVWTYRNIIILYLYRVNTYIVVSIRTIYSCIVVNMSYHFCYLIDNIFAKTGGENNCW